MAKEIILFTGPDCPSCKTVKEQFKDAIASGKITIKDIAIKEDAQFASKFCVMSLPTMVILEDGKPIRSGVGSSIVYDIQKYLDNGYGV